MDSHIDYALIDKICLSVVYKKNMIYKLHDIEERMKTLFDIFVMKNKIVHSIIHICIAQYKTLIEKISINDLPSHVPRYPQQASAYFRTSDLYVVVTKDTVPYINLYKRYPNQ